MNELEKKRLEIRVKKFTSFIWMFFFTIPLFIYSLSHEFYYWFTDKWFLHLESMHEADEANK
ncbi:MAG: hypothetical protein V4469_04560 [Patescibacteria group bacterium]